MFADLAFACVLHMLGGGKAVNADCDSAYLRQIAVTVDAAGKNFHVDPEIVVAVMHHESKFRQYTVGPFHELGLMQVKREGAIQGDWRKLSDHDLSDITLNIWIGTGYLSKFSHRCKAPVRYLTPYNGGRCVPSKYSTGILKELKAAKRRSL